MSCAHLTTNHGNRGSCVCGGGQAAGRSPGRSVDWPVPLSLKHHGGIGRRAWVIASDNGVDRGLAVPEGALMCAAAVMYAAEDEVDGEGDERGGKPSGRMCPLSPDVLQAVVWTGQSCSLTHHGGGGGRRRVIASARGVDGGLAIPEGTHMRAQRQSCMQAEDEVDGKGNESEGDEEPKDDGHSSTDELAVQMSDLVLSPLDSHTYLVLLRQAAHLLLGVRNQRQPCAF